jgi:hypothetical protein
MASDVAQSLALQDFGASISSGLSTANRQEILARQVSTFIRRINEIQIEPPQTRQLFTGSEDFCGGKEYRVGHTNRCFPGVLEP